VTNRYPIARFAIGNLLSRTLAANQQQGEQSRDAQVFAVLQRSGGVEEDVHNFSFYCVSKIWESRALASDWEKPE
jgi:hypothetical protein